MFCEERLREVMRYRGYDIGNYEDYRTKLETYSEDFNQFERHYVCNERDNVFPTQEEKQMILSNLQKMILKITKQRTPLYMALYKDILNILDTENEWKTYIGEDINDSIYEDYDSVSTLDLPNKKWTDLIRVAERCIEDIRVRSKVDNYIFKKWFINTLDLLIFFKSNVNKYLDILVTRHVSNGSTYLCKNMTSSTIELHPIFINGVRVDAICQNNEWIISSMAFNVLVKACKDFIGSLACLEK